MVALFTGLGPSGNAEGLHRSPTTAPWHAGPVILGLSALLWGAIYLLIVGLFG
jgi:hypothetical protein